MAPVTGGAPTLHRGAARARRRRRRPRRRRAAPAHARRRVPHPHRPRGRARTGCRRREPVADGPWRSPDERHRCAARRQRGHRQAQRHQDQAGARGARVRPAVADHVRAAVRATCSATRSTSPAATTASSSSPGSSPRPSSSAPRSPAPASPTTCRRASSTGSGHCRWPAPPCWRGRTASDVIYNVALDRDHVAHRAARRLAHPQPRCSRRSARFVLLLLFAYAFSWVMAYVGPARAQRRGGQQRVVHGHLPADVPGQHVRARPTTCPGRSRRSPSGTRCRR